MAPWITVLSQHTVFIKGDILQIYFCVIFHKTRHHAQAYIISGALIHCALSLAARRTQTVWVDDFAGHCLLWQLWSCKTFSEPALGLPTNLGVGRSLFFPASSIKFLTRSSLKSQWVYLAPHEDNSIQLLSIA